MMRSREEIKRSDKQLKLLDRVSQSYVLHRPPSLKHMRTLTGRTIPRQDQKKQDSGTTFFILAGIDEAFHRARIARIFSNVATG